MSTLYIVATPIGNLQDITLRALETLKRVSVVYAEDTRVTRKLLDRYEITTQVRSYHQHSGSGVIREIREALEKGDVALVTDAGTPGVADPGNELIDKITDDSLSSPRRDPSVAGQITDLKIIPIPGASAATTAASICGFNMSQFTFMGYVPKKKGRKRFFEEVAKSVMPVILYETPHRIVKTMEELKSTVGAGRDLSVQSRRIVVCRELTKIYESIYRGTIEEVVELVKKGPVKGEYVVVIDNSQ